MSEAAELWNICSVAMLLHPDFINVPWILTYYLRFGGVFNTVFAKLNKHNGYKDYDLCRFFCGLVLLATSFFATCDPASLRVSQRSTQIQETGSVFNFSILEESSAAAMFPEYRPVWLCEYTRRNGK